MKRARLRKGEIPPPAAEAIREAIRTTAEELESNLAGAAAVRDFVAVEFNRAAFEVLRDRGVSARQAAGLLGITTEAAKKLSNEKGEVKR